MKQIDTRGTSSILALVIASCCTACGDSTSAEGNAPLVEAAQPNGANLVPPPADNDAESSENSPDTLIAADGRSGTAPTSSSRPQTPSGVNVTLDDLVDFSGASVEGVDFSQCAGVTEQAETVELPADIIIVVDNSASMTGEMDQVRKHINQELAAVLEQSSIDYRVVLISEFAVTGLGICVEGPLGPHGCTSGESVADSSPKFFHHDSEVQSTDPFCRLLTGMNSPSDSGHSPGWMQHLRQESFKSIIFITDDSVSCTVSPGELVDVDGRPISVTLSDQRTADGGARAARLFNAALIQAGQGSFGELGNIRYKAHSLVGMKGNSSGALWQPNDPVQADRCGTPGTLLQVTGAGTGYQALSRMTGGLRWSLCELGTFEPVFKSLTEEITETTRLSCAWSVPTSQSTELSLQEVNLVLRTDSGDSQIGHRVTDPKNCDLGGWFVDATGSDPLITACPETCRVLQDQESAKVELMFGCQQILQVPKVAR